MSNDFTIKDSGERKEFASGMVRDVTTGKIAFHKVLDGPMFDRWAAHLTKGAEKYPDVAPGKPNWMLASGEQELQRFRESAFRHFRQWLNGNTDEDHAAAVFFNINGYEYVKQKMAMVETGDRLVDNIKRNGAPFLAGDSVTLKSDPALNRVRIRCGRCETSYYIDERHACFPKQVPVNHVSTCDKCCRVAPMNCLHCYRCDDCCDCI